MTSTGRVLAISAPRVGSRSASQISPRLGPSVLCGGASFPSALSWPVSSLKLKERFSVKRGEGCQLPLGVRQREIRLVNRRGGVGSGSKVSPSLLW